MNKFMSKHPGAALLLVAALLLGPVVAVILLSCPNYELLLRPLSQTIGATLSIITSLILTFGSIVTILLAIVAVGAAISERRGV